MFFSILTQPKGWVPRQTTVLAGERSIRKTNRQNGGRGVHIKFLVIQPTCEEISPFTRRQAQGEGAGGEFVEDVLFVLSLSKHDDGERRTKPEL
jgi:hypothetical protein